MHQEALREELEMLAHQIADLTGSHSGRLCSVVVAVPGPATARFRRAIETSLSDAGIDFVDVTVQQDAGPLRVLHLAYES